MDGFTPPGVQLGSGTGYPSLIPTRQECNGGSFQEVKYWDSQSTPD
jgi:hypothetical protein